MKLTYIREGILFDPRDYLSQYPNHHLRQDPIYIVDLTTPYTSLMQYVTCYPIDKETLKAYSHTKHTVADARKLRRKYSWKMMIKEPYYKPKALPVKRGKFKDKIKAFIKNPLSGPKTTLAKAADNEYQKHREQYLKETISKPYFTSVVCTGTDTFGKNICRGFAERNPTESTVYKGKKHLIIGDLTGVFISLDYILWLRNIYPKGDLLRQVKSQVSDVHNMYYMYRG